MLGIGKDEYTIYADFRRRVIESCQIALAEHTDIRFTYEPYGKKGISGKILALRFIISKNDNHSDELTLETFIAKKQVESTKQSVYDERIDFFAEACNNEFSINEIKIVNTILASKMQERVFSDKLKVYDYLLKKYQELNWRDEQHQIKKRFNYFKAIIESDKMQY